MKKTCLQPAPEKLQKFQHDYSNFLKDPHYKKRPAGIPERQSTVYEELLFSNLCGFIDKCFPVSQSTVPEKYWSDLCRTFFRDWPCTTPYFTEIPKEFTDFLQSEGAPNDAPDWLAELTHYEWIELCVETHPGEVKPTAGGLYANEQSRALQYHLPLKSNPTLQILQYEWPVQKISETFQPTEKELTHLLVYRNSDHNVEFMATNMITAAMLELIEQTPATLDVTIEALSHLINNTAPEQLKVFAEPIVENLLNKQVITH